jgi:excisionase family DNA binding protein
MAEIGTRRAALVREPHQSVVTHRKDESKIVSILPTCLRSIVVSLGDAREARLNKTTINQIQHQAGLLRIGAFCTALEIKEATVRKWLHERRIASVKVGSRAIRIPRSEVGRIIREGFRPARLRAQSGKNDRKSEDVAKIG